MQQAKNGLNRKMLNIVFSIASIPYALDSSKINVAFY